MSTTPQRFDKGNLALRVGTAAIFGVLFFSLLYFGERPWAKLTWLLFMALALVMGVREMCLIARKGGHHPSILAGSLVGLGFLLHFYFSGGDALSAVDPLPLWLVLAGGGMLIHFGALLFHKDPLENALSSQAITWLSALYMGLGTGFMVKLFMFNDTTLSNTGARLILALFIIVWFGDTGAYFLGSAFGKHKLAPRVSPKKSWEGALGNVLGNLGGAFLMRAFVCTQWTPVDAIAIGLLLGLVGQLGDLVESTWKRSAGVKDSNIGISIPGHGGMLDRVDSLVFAAPALYAYVHFVHGLN
jgi:phosphatidate cytidylyltransferase